MIDFNLLCDSGLFDSIDIHFAKFILGHRIAVKNDAVIAAFASRAVQKGHSCFDIEIFIENERKVFLEKGVEIPAFEVWKDACEKSRLVGVPGEKLPLVFDGKRIYLYRYWRYETNIASSITERSFLPEKNVDESILDKLNLIFPADENGENLQREGALKALKKYFSIISGGPGTGKTTTVANIIALFIESFPDVRIALAAPTGKAAARMNESIKGSILRLRENFSKDVAEAVSSISGITIHRLLGSKPDSIDFRHDKYNQLDYDLIVIDEASMISLSLFSRFLDAVPLDSTIILLGDKDQLASVEAGSILADITGCVSDESSDFNSCVTVLKKSYRFDSVKGIGNLSRAVNNLESPERIFKLFASDENSGIEFKDIFSERDLEDFVKERCICGYRDFIEEKDVAEALKKINKFRFLCSLRKGYAGVENVNTLVERFLKEAGLLNPTALNYENRLVMVTENDYSLGLFNGDVGILRKDETGEIRAFFESSNGIRTISTSMLPSVETVFAMTVHKSQGSEFDEAVFILPFEENPVVTAELVYTAVTRAKKKAVVAGRKDIFTLSVSRKVRRSSGLFDNIKRFSQL